MTIFRRTLAASVMIGLLNVPALTSAEEQPPTLAAADFPHSGAHDFDFEHGTWLVHHRIKRQGATAWSEFEGTCRARELIDGSANVEEHTFQRPAGVTYGIALRAYDPTNGLWAI